MKKIDLIAKFNDLSNRVDDLKATAKSMLEEVKEIQDIIDDELPSEPEEIENDEDPEDADKHDEGQ